MPKEKAKHMPKRAPRRLSWRKVMAITIALIVLILVILILLAPTYHNDARITQTSLPDDLQPLAEEILLSVPINEYIPVTDDISLQLEYLENSYPPLTVDGLGGICIWFNWLRDNPYALSSHIFINGEKVKGLSYVSGLGNLDGVPWYARCASGNLEAGLHLIEFHLRDSTWGEPVTIQRWAIEIE